MPRWERIRATGHNAGETRKHNVLRETSRLLGRRSLDAPCILSQPPSNKRTSWSEDQTLHRTKGTDTPYLWGWAFRATETSSHWAWQALCPAKTHFRQQKIEFAICGPKGKASNGWRWQYFGVLVKDKTWKLKERVRGEDIHHCLNLGSNMVGFG